MKNLIITIVVIIAVTILLKSQTQQPSALYFQIPQSSGTYTKQFDISDIEYKQNNFMLGWHWGDEPMITKTLLMNQCDIDSKSNPS